MTTPEVTPSTILFPAGPSYRELQDSDDRIAWVRHKVWVADWYTATLGELGEQLGDYGANVGVEMALDGALASLSGAFDASVALLITSVEDALGVPDEKRTKVNYTWGGLTKRVVGSELNGSPGVAELLQAVEGALEGQKADEPVGWLALLRRLRNRTTHQAALPRLWERDTNGELAVSGMTTVPGLDPFEYLQAVCDMTSDLTEQMLRVANSIRCIGANTPLLRTGWRELAVEPNAELESSGLLDGRAQHSQ